MLCKVTARHKPVYSVTSTPLMRLCSVSGLSITGEDACSSQALGPTPGHGILQLALFAFEGAATDVCYRRSLQSCAAVVRYRRSLQSSAIVVRCSRLPAGVRYSRPPCVPVKHTAGWVAACEGRRV